MLFDLPPCSLGPSTYSGCSASKWMLAVIIGENGKKDTEENSGQWSRLTSDPSESADDTTHHFCLPLGRRSLTSESHQETLVKGEGWALGLAFIAFLPERVYLTFCSQSFAYSPSSGKCLPSGSLSPCDPWVAILLHKWNRLASCFVVLFEPHKNPLSSWPLSHFPERNQRVRKETCLQSQG